MARLSLIPDQYTFWLTGFSGAGKTTLAHALTLHLRTLGKTVCMLDGDELRSGLCRDLSFSAADREENIRRTAELALLLNRQGVDVIVALVSPPCKAEPLPARSSAALALLRCLSPPRWPCASSVTPKVCTGVQSPYEAPSGAELVIDTSQTSLTDALHNLTDTLARHSVN